MQPPINLEDYGVSVDHGFLPQESLLQQLPIQYQAWETIASDLPVLISKEKIMNAVLELPILPIEDLNSIQEYRRAYVLLGFIANGYLWGAEKPLNRLPASVAVPYVAVAAYLDIPPVATYAAENLWNFAAINPDLSIEDPDNFRALTTFTGTSDESWFYSLPAAIEMRGRHVIPLALQAFDAADGRNVGEVVHVLKDIASHIEALTILLPRMYEKNNASVFYKRIRPFLAGTTDVDLPDGVLYEDGKGGGDFKKLKGPTAAQSPLFHLLDEVLGVSHHSTGKFLQEMRLYMWAPHRRFLSLMASKANIRPFVKSLPDEADIQAAYTDCLNALAEYRTKHLQMVSRYIVIPSKAAVRSDSVIETEPGTAGRVPSGGLPINGEKVVKPKPTLGSGVTAPVEFLRTVRNETRDNL